MGADNELAAARVSAVVNRIPADAMRVFAAVSATEEGARCG